MTLSTTSYLDSQASTAVRGRHGTPLLLLLSLAFWTAIPVLVSAVRVVQIPLGMLPAESLRLATAPTAHFLHALAGVLFGVLGPLQFVLSLRRSFGVLHRLSGRGFVLSGLVLGVSAQALLWQVESTSNGLVDATRGIFGSALVASLVLGVRAARTSQLSRHRAWMVRAYAIGMGSGSIAMVMLPIHLLTGAPLKGPIFDTMFVCTWITSVAVGEWINCRMSLRQPPQVKPLT